MPKIEDIIRGRKLGYKDGHRYIWAACIDCGKERWVSLYKGNPKSLRCKSCAKHLTQVNHCKLSEEATNWINGELLGDGCLKLKSPKPESIYSARFDYGSKYEEYIRYVSDTLSSFGIEQSGKIGKRHSYNCENPDCYTYHYTSRSYVELLTIYKKWYPNGKKIVPRDIRLTPLTCRQWYIGDGNLKGLSVRLFTNSFPISDVEWLIKQLISLGFKATRRRYYNIIGISTCSTKEFLDYMGSCPVNCYQYKFNYKHIDIHTKIRSRDKFGRFIWVY